MESQTEDNVSIDEVVGGERDMDRAIEPFPATITSAGDRCGFATDTRKT